MLEPESKVEICSGAPRSHMSGSCGSTSTGLRLGMIDPHRSAAGANRSKPIGPSIQIVPEAILDPMEQSFTTAAVKRL
jgi:hypothetical protein